MTTTGLIGMLHKLELTPTAINVLSVMFERSEPGGVVDMNQADIDAVLGVGQASMSRAMSLLVDRGLVLRSGNGRGHRYALNPAIAGYSSEAEMQKEMTQQLATGGPPPILVPEYQKRPPKAGSGGLLCHLLLHLRFGGVAR
ncbi:helix-turn-helix domain-containing protein, partial [Streptomyces sp. WAC05374]|uniref:MarR family transcriptional regulator n=1 Tax=Streptomyces sp. WAC05374 TaxID=2487420 RepID=UPI00163BA255